MSNRGASFFALCLKMTYHAIEYTRVSVQICLTRPSPETGLRTN
jgi:hypothetical protein